VTGLAYVSLHSLLNPFAEIADLLDVCLADFAAHMTLTHIGNVPLKSCRLPGKMQIVCRNAQPLGILP
jgi:hypothetical protein